MNKITYEILDKYQVRKSKKQKTAFIEYIEGVCAQMGYSCQVEHSKSYGTRNIVIGNPETAKVVFGAHYDTCAVLPFPNFITPKKFFVYLLYQCLITVLMLIPYALIIYVGTVINGELWALTGSFAYLYILAFIALIMVGPANKHTANDNTSGVVTLIDLMAALPEEKRNDVAFVLFDLEEVGTFGSAAFAKMHKNTMKDKLFVNFDCVSDGNNILFAVKKSAKRFVPMLTEAYKSNGFYNVDIATKGVFYPSDQANFKCGVGVAALKKSEKFNVLYMDKIHTKKDIVFQEENIKFLVDGSVKLVEILNK